MSPAIIVDTETREVKIFNMQIPIAQCGATEESNTYTHIHILLVKRGAKYAAHENLLSANFRDVEISTSCVYLL